VKQTVFLFISIFLLLLAASCGSSDSSSDDDSGDDDAIDDDNDDDVSDDDTVIDDDSSDDDSTDDDTVDDDTIDDDTIDDDTIDPEDDEDRDGISNGQEMIDGTDPLDPSDALAWHPEWSARPRLYGDAATWQAAKEAVETKDAEATFLYARIATVAAYTPQAQPAGSYNFSITDYNAEVAANAVLAAFIDDDASLAQKAVEILAELDVDFLHLPPEQFDQGSIHGAQALLNACFAYDLLVGFALIDEPQATTVAAAILDFAGDLYFFEVTLPFGWFYMNNHVIKLAAALAVAGMTLNDNPQAAVYVNFGLTTAPYFLLEYQTPVGGGHGEGPHYFDYSMKTWLPFVTAYHRFAQGETYPYRIDCRPRFFLPCDKVNTDVVDPLLDPRTDALLDWRIALTMPDGRIPPIDDSFTSCGRSGAVAPVYDRGDFARHYFAEGDCQRAWTGLEILQLALFDQMPAPHEPDVLSVCNQAAGQAVLRNDWSAQSHYALLNGEHGTARLSGLGHEHPDATSFILYAHGEMLALDSGYQSFGERMLVAPAENHNLILVDGQGPPMGLTIAWVGVDSYLTDFVDEPPFRSVQVATTYQQADITRRLLLIDDDYFVTTEIVEADAAHTYAWLLHANAGGTTDGTFTLETDGALIERPNGVMRTTLQSDAAPTFTEYEEEHGFVDGGEVQWHAVMRAEVQAARARFLGVHATAETVGGLPVIAPYAQTDVMAYFVEGEDFFDAVIVNEGGDFVVTTENGAPGRIESDASFVWLRADPDTQELLTARRLDGTYLLYNGAP